MFRLRSRSIATLAVISICIGWNTPGIAEPKAVSVGGNYLALINVFDVDGRGATEPRRSQMEFAANIDFEWQVAPAVNVTMQLQGGTGGGSLGMAGPETVVTDLNVAFDITDPALVVTLGSFDTPFGEETPTLTNNAGAFSNSLFLNSLFYSTFGGTVGTLNTLGAMGTLSGAAGDVTLAITNGTDESAANPDGNFEWVASAGTSALLDGLRLSGSWMLSNDTFDRDSDASSGFGADFMGFMVDGRYEVNTKSHVKGYYGVLTYGDNLATTEDGVAIWMGEAAYGDGAWQLVFRVSGWNPDDDNADGAGISRAILDPGLTSAWSAHDSGPPATCVGPCPTTDQSIVRFQAGGSWYLQDDLMLKLEYVRDDYDQLTSGRSTDVDGLMLVLNGQF